MQTKRTKKAGIVGKYGKFYIKICLFDIHLLKFIDQWEDVLLFFAFTLLARIIVDDRKKKVNVV